MNRVNRLPRILEEWEKTGPRILKSLAGIAARLIMVLLSHSTSSDFPILSNLIHNLAPAAFFFPFPSAAPRVLLLGSGSRGGGEGEEIPGAGGWAGNCIIFFKRRRLEERRKENVPLPIPSLSSPSRALLINYEGWLFNRARANRHQWWWPQIPGIVSSSPPPPPSSSIKPTTWRWFHEI